MIVYFVFVLWMIVYFCSCVTEKRLRFLECVILLCLDFAFLCFMWWKNELFFCLDDWIMLDNRICFPQAFCYSKVPHLYYLFQVCVLSQSINSVMLCGCWNNMTTDMTSKLLSNYWFLNHCHFTSNIKFEYKYGNVVHISK